MKKKQIIDLVVFILGMITLIVGVVFLILSLTKGAGIQDGEYLVSAKEWVLESNGTNCENAEVENQTNCESPSVIWQFTEIGKGTLTTNSHLNDYDFIWALEDGKMKIETDWLYELENEYEYELNQRDGTLILRSDEDEYRFTAEFETE